MDSLKNIVHVGEERLIELYDQFRPTAGTRLKTIKAGVKTPATLEAELERWQAPPEGWAHLLDLVTGALRDSGQLAALRPQTMRDYHEYREKGWSYVAESNITATRLQVPVSAELTGKGLPPEINVWIADPDRLPDEPAGPFTYEGTFLLLVEELAPAETPAAPHFFSGASALFQVAQLVQEYERVGGLPWAIDRDERFGRGSNHHPIEKLKTIGARVSLPRTVDVVYQIRYMSDEQLFIPSPRGGERRVNDLLGYPLAIWVE
jgi:hypothetical protein